MCAKVTEELINSEPEALARLSKNDTGIKAVFNEICEFFEEILTKLNGESEKAYALKKARQFRKLMGDKENAKHKGYLKYSILNVNGFGNVVFLDEKMLKTKNYKTYKDAIKHFFVNNLKNTEITLLENGDTVNFDQIGKFLHPGETVEKYKEKLTAIEILKDIVKIGKNKKHLDDLMVNGKVKKHSGYDAFNGWDYYDTYFCVDNSGVVYGGTIIVRKSKNGKDYFYDLDNIREAGYQDELKNYPVKYGQTSLKNNIPYQVSIVNNNSMQDTKKYSITKPSESSNSQTVEKPEARKRAHLIPQNNEVFKTEDIRHKVTQKILKDFSVPINSSDRAGLKKMIDA